MARQLDPTEATFDVVVKVAERCNLACTYCYYYFKEYDGTKNKPSILPEVMDELPRFLSRSVEQLNLSQLNISLHGGEPLLMKKPLFDRLCTNIRAALDGKVRLGLAVQTNGVLIDDEWIDLFAKHEIGVGVSIDGTKELHDRRRVDHAGRGSYDATVAGLRQLQAAVKDGRLSTAGAIGVVDADGGEELLRHLALDLGIDHPNLNFPRGGLDCPEAQTWNGAVESHRKMVRFALENLVYPKYHFVRSITDVLLAMYSDDGAQLHDHRCSLRHSIATITSEGVILPDDNLLSVDPRFAESRLTIFGTSLRDFVESPLWQSLVAAVDYVPERCGDCEWYRCCRSGELCNRFSRNDATAEHSVLCDTLKMLHEEVASYLVRNRIVSVEELARRLARSPTISAADLLRTVRKQQPDGVVTDEAPSRRRLPIFQPNAGAQ